MVMMYTTFRFLRLHGYEILIECLKHLYHLNGIGIAIQSEIKIAVIEFFVCVGIPHKVVIFSDRILKVRNVICMQLTDILLFTNSESNYDKSFSRMTGCRLGNRVRFPAEIGFLSLPPHSDWL
jgi:hypothetical protein